jgi:hypothetical protein
MNPKMLKKVLAILVFAISFIVYFMTMAPTVSFWDCGEFIACAYTQGVPHPPGAPLFLMVARIFTMLPEFIGDVAFRVNLISVITSAFTILFLFLIIARFSRWMIRKEDIDDTHLAINYMGAFVGALVFAFTRSFWFNAVEAEVYAPSMFFTSIIVWLIMRWGDKHQQPGNEKYLILIAYLIGLAIGVHLLNVLALPFIVYIVYFRRYKFTVNGFLIASIIGVLITGVTKFLIVEKILVIPREFGFFGLLLFFLALIALAGYFVKLKRPVVSLALMSVVVMLIGYSTYGYIYVRSGLDPNIDENDPETIERFISYMEREQYGVSQGFYEDYVNRNAPFFEYQINKMYVRYFKWQFLGRDDRTEAVDYTKFLFLPLVMGFFGLYKHIKESPQYAFATFVLWFMTGLAIVLYVNQPDPQPRERDYSYVGSFFAFSIWIGIGATELIRLLRKFTANFNSKQAVMAGSVLLLVPGLMLSENYNVQDRTGNYVAWDYSYNMLNSMEEGAIIYTNGDNDTFPLWYLQEVEKIRTDVRIINLSLLNTDWYIKQIKSIEPKAPITISDRVIEGLGPSVWPKERHQQNFYVTKATLEAAIAEYNRQFPKRPIQSADQNIRFEVPPTFRARNVEGIKVADLMMLHILANSRLETPIYYSVTVSPDNMLGGLRDYMRMDGLVFKVTPLKNWPISPDAMYENLMNVYQYRGLNDSTVYFNNSTRSLLQNYRTAFLQVGDYYLRHNNIERAKELLEKLDASMPDHVVPIGNVRLKAFLDLYRIAIGDFGIIPEEAAGLNWTREVEFFAQNFVASGNLVSAANCYKYLTEYDPTEFKYMRLYADVLDRQQKQDLATTRLQSWLTSNPNDTVAKTYIENRQERLASGN